MGPSQSQLKLLSPRDRLVYKQWLRCGLWLYGSVVLLLAAAIFANHVFISLPLDGDTLHTAAISARK